MASRSSFWIMAPIRRSGISTGARRSTLPLIMRLVQRRSVVAAVPLGGDAGQAHKLVEAAVALQPAEGAEVVLLVMVPVVGTQSLRWPRVLKCRASRSST